MGACCTPSATVLRFARGAARGRAPVRAVAWTRPHRPPANSRWATTARTPCPAMGKARAARQLSTFSIAPATVTNREFGDFVRATRYATDAERAGARSCSICNCLRNSVANRPAGCVRPAVVGAGRRRLVAAAGGPAPTFTRGRIIRSCTFVARRAGVLRVGGSAAAERSGMGCAARGGLERRRFRGATSCVATACLAAMSGAAVSRSARRRWLPGPSPADAGEPNGFGLHNVCGNVWEWCDDWFTPGGVRCAAARSSATTRTATAIALRRAIRIRPRARRATSGSGCGVVDDPHAHFVRCPLKAESVLRGGPSGLVLIPPHAHFVRCPLRPESVPRGRPFGTDAARCLFRRGVP